MPPADGRDTPSEKLALRFFNGPDASTLPVNRRNSKLSSLPSESSKRAVNSSSSKEPLPWASNTPPPEIVSTRKISRRPRRSERRPPRSNPNSPAVSMPPLPAISEKDERATSVSIRSWPASYLEREERESISKPL